MSDDVLMNVYTYLLSDLPLAFAIVCGLTSLESMVIAKLSAYGMQLDPNALVGLVLDMPLGFAIVEIERLVASGRRIVAMTWNPCPEYWADLTDLGAQIVVVGEQPDRVLRAAIQHAAYGAHYQIAPELPMRLTPIERRVLHLLARGGTNQQIAARIALQDKTIRNMLTTIYLKLEVADRSGALLYYWGVTPTVALTVGSARNSSEQEM